MFRELGHTGSKKFLASEVVVTTWPFDDVGKLDSRGRLNLFITVILDGDHKVCHYADVFCKRFRYNDTTSEAPAGISKIVAHDKAFDLRMALLGRVFGFRDAKTGLFSSLNRDHSAAFDLKIPLQ